MSHDITSHDPERIQPYAEWAAQKPTICFNFLI